MKSESTTSMRAVEPDERGLIAVCPQCGQRNRLPYPRLGQTGRCPNCHAELPAVNEPIDISSGLIFQALTARSALPVLVDFWAPWCGPCKMVAPEVAKVAASGAGCWLVVKVNTEELPDIAQEFRISAIPLFAVFKGGREVGRQSGALPAVALTEFLQRHL
jgi:thioredoxin 2